MISPVEKVVGVLGGMGPEATAVFLHRLVQLTDARYDQDHLKIVVVNNPKIPDRVAHITGSGTSPVPALVEAAQDLVRLGAEIIAIPCNTAHYFWREVQDSVPVPVLNIITETVAAIAEQLETGSKVGILSTRATADLGLYQVTLETFGLAGICPDAAHQANVTKAIDRIKQEGDRQEAASLLEPCLVHLQAQGIRAAIFGCTELGLAPLRTDLQIFDSLELLARKTVATGQGTAVPAEPSSEASPRTDEVPSLEARISKSQARGKPQAQKGNIGNRIRDEERLSGDHPATRI